MMSGMRSTLVAMIMFMAWGLLGCTELMLMAQEPQASPPADEVWKLRRILVPESELDAVVRGRYLPLDLGRFQSLIDKNRQRTNVAAQWPLEHLHLRGELQPSGELVGSGYAQVATAVGSEPWLTLTPPNFFVGGFSWLDLEGDEARVGIGLRDHWYIENVGARQLGFDWAMVPSFTSSESTRGTTVAETNHTDAHSSLVFILELPGVALSSLHLTVPEPWVLSIDEGVCRKLAVAPEAGREGLAQWQVEFSKPGTHRLVLKQSDDSRLVQAPLSFQSDTNFEVGVGWVASHTTFRWEGGSFELLPLLIPPGWAVMGVKSEAVDLPFQVNETGEDANVWVTVSSGAQAVQEIEVELERHFDFAERLQLKPPQLKATWTRGSISIEVNPLLQVLDWQLFDAQWFNLQSNGEGPKQLQAECFSEHSSLELQVDVSPEDLQGTAYTQVVAEGQKLSAEVHLWGQPSSVTSLEWRYPLSEGWIVDQVTLMAGEGGDSGELLESWDIVQSDSGPLVDVHLKQAIPEGTQVHVQMQAHLLAFPSPADRLKPETLGVIDLRNLDEWEHWLGVQAEPPHRFVWLGAEGMAIRPLATAERILELQMSASSQRLQLIEKGENRDFFQIQNEPSEQFEADYEIRCDIDDRTVSQQVKIHCRPLDSRLSRILLRWPEARTGTWSWRLERSNGLQSRRLVPLDDFDLETKQTTTLLEWNERLDEPFTLVGECSQVWAAPWSPQVPVVSRAQRLTGTVTLVSQSSQALMLQPARLERLPNAIAGSINERKLMGVFDLSEVLTQQSGVKDRLALQSVQASRMKPVVWKAILESWPGAIQSRHRLTLEVEVAGPSNLRLQSMQGCDLKTATVDRKSMSAGDLETSTESTEWNLPIDSTPVRQKVVVEFTRRESLDQIFETLKPPLPESDAVWMDTQWVVHFPSGYQEVEWQPTPADGSWWNWGAWLMWRWTGINPVRGGDRSKRSGSAAFPTDNPTSEFSETEIWSEAGVSSETQLRLEKRGVAGGLYTLVALCVAVVLLTLGRSLSKMYWVMTGFCVIGVLWLPLDWQVWTRALVPGCVLALAIHSIRKPLDRGRVITDESPQSHASRVPALALIGLWFGALLLASLAEQVRGAVQEQVDTAEAPRWVDVIIPVGEDGQPVQDLVYLPKAFKDQLLKTTPRSDVETPWIIENAQHVIDVENNSLSDVSRWKLSSRFKLRTLQPKARFTLPFSAAQVLVLADQVQLDQNVISVSGTPQSGLTIEIESPGLHDLVVPGFLLLPNSKDQPFLWTPPQVPDSDFRLNGLAGSGWDLENTRPWVESLDLGTDRLRLRGRTAALRFQPRVSLSSDQESQPTLGIAETVFREGEDLFVTVWFRPDDADGLPETIAFNVGPGWEVQSKPLPADCEFRLSRQGDESICELVLPAEQEVPIAAIQLKLSEPLRAGQWKLPVLSSKAFTVSSRQLILDSPVDALWSYSRPGNPLASEIREEMGTLWSAEQLDVMGLDPKETSAIELPRSFVDEFLEVGPDSSILSADQQIDFFVDWSETKFQGSALVSVMRGEVGSIEIESNQPFSLSDVEVTRDGVMVPVERVKLSPSRVLLMFDERIRSVFTLNFSGFVPRNQSEGPIPVVQINGIQDVTYRCRLRRSPLAQTRMWPLDQEVLTGFSIPGDMRRSSTTNVPILELNDLDLELKDRRETEFQIDGRQLLQLKKNWRLVVERARDPLIDDVLAKYERENTEWRLTFWVRVAEDEPWGLELLDLDVPENFIAVNQSEQGAWIEEEKTLLNHQRRWVANRRILPGQWVAIEGAMPRFPNGSFQPRLINNLPRTYRVALPKAQQDDTFQWQHNSTEVSGFSDEEAGRLESDREWLVLQREGLGEGVRLSSKPLVIRPTRVHLADYRVFWREDGVSVSCRFVVDPGGQASLPYHVPTEFELRAIEIDGQLQPLPEEGVNTIRLANRELPQEVTLWCHAPWREGRAHALNQQVLPWLAMPAEVTLLAVNELRHSRLPLDMGGVARTSYSAWEKAIREANQKVMQVTSTNTQLSPVALEKWMEFWVQRSLATAAGLEFAVDPSERRVEVGESGELVWELRPDSPFADGRIRQTGGQAPNPLGWRYYMPVGQERPLKLSVKQRPPIDRADLVVVTALLAFMMTAGGWGALRLSRPWRLVGMLVLTLFAAAGWSAVQGPLWIGAVVVVACILGLFKLILQPVSPELHRGV